MMLNQYSELKVLINDVFSDSIGLGQFWVIPAFSLHYSGSEWDFLFHALSISSVSLCFFSSVRNLIFVLIGAWG